MGIILQDNFVGVNDTALAAHTPNVGGPWVSGTPGWKIESNTCKQMVNSAESHVVFSEGFLRVAFTFSVAGIDAGNSLEMDIVDAGESNGINCLILADGEGVFEYVASGGSPGEVDLHRGTLKFDPTVYNTALVDIGPDRIRYYINGAKMADLPRYFAKSFKFEHFTMKAFTLNAAPGPVIKNVFVGF